MIDESAASAIVALASVHPSPLPDHVLADLELIAESPHLPGWLRRDASKLIERRGTR